MDTFKTLQSFKHGKLYSLPALGQALGVKVQRLPVSIRIVLESVLRNCDGKKVTDAHVRQLAHGNETLETTEVDERAERLHAHHPALDHVAHRERPCQG